MRQLRTGCVMLALGAAAVRNRHFAKAPPNLRSSVTGWRALKQRGTIVNRCGGRFTVSLLVGATLAIGCHTPLGSTTQPGADMATAVSHVAGDFVGLAGLTSDGWAIVVDAAQTVSAISLADHTQHKVVDNAKSEWIDDGTLFVTFDVGSDGNGGLIAWQNGRSVKLADASPDQTLAFSYPVADASGEHLAYLTTVANQANLVVDRADHSAPHALLTGIGLNSSGCWPRMYFFEGRLVVAHCTGAVGTSEVVTSYDPDTGAGIDLSPTSYRFFATHAGVGVLVITPTGQASIIPAAGGNARLLADDIAGARFFNDGSAALLITKGGALERVAIADGAVTVLQPSGVHTTEAISPDDRLLAYFSTQDPNTLRNDQYLASATQASAPIALVAATTSVPLGYLFSDDSTWAYYLADVDVNTGAGSLRARPVTGGVERTLGAGVYDFVPTGGTRLVFSDNLTNAGASPGLADVEIVDLAQGGTPTKVATQVYSLFDVTADNHTVAWVQPGDGLYLYPLP